MKRKVKRYAEGKEVEIEERSIKTPRLIAEEKAKAPEDYAGLGGRARATSPFSGPKEYITESKETEVESEAPKGIAAGFDAKRYLEESESKGGGTRSETKPAVAKKTAKKAEPKKVTSSPKYEDTGAKIGSQGGFRFDSEKSPSSTRTAADIRAGRAAAEEKPSKIPKVSFLTPERLESSRKSYYSGFDSKPVRSAADIRAGRGMKSGGKVSSASSRADGIAQRGKTRGKVC
jgi:hypothetical protein